MARVIMAMTEVTPCEETRDLTPSCIMPVFRSPVRQVTMQNYSPPREEILLPHSDAFSIIALLARSSFAP
ncbi:MAG TPA: hypothetical protein GX507_10900 [Clostridia bacterium]|nr:hypothetical protein [Clostridia bacterium]